MSNRGLEVYVYQGGPRIVIQHLIIQDGVGTLPKRLCYEYEHLQKVTFCNGLTTIGPSAFYHCENLLEISQIPRTVQVIGEDAFARCEQLKAVEFEDDNGTSPHQLRIGMRAFARCMALERVKLPSFVNHVGFSAFSECSALTEANLSATLITMIAPSTFCGCASLQVVSLPVTLKWIDGCAFYQCWNLVTVRVARGTNAIKIGDSSFSQCRKLLNFVLPHGSSAERSSFAGCKLLRERWVGDVLELAVWKMKLEEEGATESDARESCRISCGSDIVIKNVMPFLNDDDDDSDSDDDDSDDDDSDFDYSAYGQLQVTPWGFRYVGIVDDEMQFRHFPFH